MKKIFTLTAAIILLGTVLGVGIASAPSFATGGTDNMVFKACSNSQNTGVCKNHEDNKSFELIGPDGIITKIAQIIVWLVGIVSVLMIAIGGFRYATSGGDAAGVNGAKNSILYALVGLAIAIFAQVIVSFVLSNL